MPNVGPIAGWRRATVALLPMCLKACPRPTVVVVFPSPRGVGVIADTTTYFASGRSSNSPMAMPSAISGNRLSFACRAISKSEGNVCIIWDSSWSSLGGLSRFDGLQLLAPRLGLAHLVEGVDVEPFNFALRVYQRGG